MLVIGSHCLGEWTTSPCSINFKQLLLTYFKSDKDLNIKKDLDVNLLQSKTYRIQGWHIRAIAAHYFYNHAFSYPMLNGWLSITFNDIRYKWPPRRTSCIIGLSADSAAHFSSANAYSFLAIKLKDVWVIKYRNKQESFDQLAESKT